MPSKENAGQNCGTKLRHERVNCTIEIVSPRSPNIDRHHFRGMYAIESNFDGTDAFSASILYTDPIPKLARITHSRPNTLLGTYMDTTGGGFVSRYLIPR